MLIEGQKFGEKERYELIRQLGRGGFSEVWLAEDSWTHVQVAIKVYAPGTGLDEAGIQLFTQEFSLVFDMNHTNLLKPTYFDSWERQPYLIMPLCKNGSAFKYVTGQERISEDECWKLLHDVSAGLAYLHGKNPPLIHQDIKPDNVLISDEGRYMITDFGISARVRSTIRGGLAQEQSGGTLAYMGPERFSSRPRPIMASDIWSLGAMMYELICGMPPFGNNGGLMQKKGAEIPVIEEEGYSQELKDIIYQCLAEDPSKRLWAETIEEMTYNHIHGIPISQRQVQQPAVQSQPQPQPVSHLKRDVPPKAKAKKPLNKKLIGLAVAAVLLVALVLVFSLGGSDNKEQMQAAVQETPKVDVDSIAQLKLIIIRDDMNKAEEFQQKFSDELTNSDNGKVEDYYIDIIRKSNEFESEAASSVGDTPVPVTALVDELRAARREAESQLLAVYGLLEGDATSLLQEKAQSSAAVLLKERAEAIMPYIEHLLTDNQTEETEE